MRTQLKTAALAAALMLGASGLALAQSGSSSVSQTPGAGGMPGQAQHQMQRSGTMGSSAPSGAHDPATMGQSADSRPGSGTMQHSMAMDENDLRNLLRGQGYSDIQSVSRDGDNFRVGVTRNGRPATIVVDAYTGTIRNQAARR